MVTFILVEEDEEKLVFWYYPEARKDKEPGVIVVDRKKEQIEITKVAEEDWEREISAEELNEMSAAINEMARERGEADFVEFVRESEHSVYYGDHAVREIIEHLQKGEVPKRGMQMWY